MKKSSSDIQRQNSHNSASKLTLRQESGHYRVFIRVGVGAVIPSELRKLSLHIANMRQS